MKKTLAVLAAAALVAPSAFAAEITPYAGLGFVVDKAGTSAKRVGFDPMAADPIVRDGGGDMKFDMAFAGEITAGVKYGQFRAELEAAFRSASEDEYDIFEGTLPMGPVNVATDIETSTSVRHNSYLANFYYDFAIADSKWEPYIGVGLGIGTYKQKATVDIEGHVAGQGQVIDESETVVEQDKTVFEWQVALGTAYHFTEDWALDFGYRFNSSTISDEFVYAHELKLGVRYSF